MNARNTIYDAMLRFLCLEGDAIGKGESHDAATTLRQKVFEAIGEASTCWSNLDGAGIFDAAAASSIAERLCADLGLPVSADLLDGDQSNNNNMEDN